MKLLPLKCRNLILIVNDLLTVRKKHVKEIQNEEPEWFTFGPSSQFETMELKGFDDDELEKRGNVDNCYFSILVLATRCKISHYYLNEIKYLR